MFGVLFLERDPLTLADAPGDLIHWVQVTGSVAGIALLFWLTFSLAGQRPHAAEPDSSSARPWLTSLFKTLFIGAFFGYALLLGIRFPDLLETLTSDNPPGAPPAWRVSLGNLAFTVGASCALLAVLLPFFVNMLAMRGRRILAVARLSFKEAVRRKVLYVFCGLIIVLLFLNWFVQSKPEDQLKSYVEIVFRTMTPLLLVSAALLASFSIPTDIKQQTIHTVVTKPVERFEIVLGRFLGYTALLTLVLIVMTALSLLYVLRGANPAAAAESLKAREPIYATSIGERKPLSFERVENEYTPNERSIPIEGENIGRVWDYHRYISGQDERNLRESVMYAVWGFQDLPSKLAKQDTIRCEFSFDIYRQSKGQENRGILCSFFFMTPQFEKSLANLGRYQESRRIKGAGADLEPDIDNELSEEFGYFEVQGKDVRNLHTLHVDIPAGLIRNALQRGQGGAANEPLLMVRVRCGSPGQMVGMARYSLYLRGDGPKDEYDKGGFALNYFKASAGLWMRLVLVSAVSVAVSTQLGGIISFLCVMLLYGGGALREFIKELGEKAHVGGGPVELAFRLFGRKTMAQPLEESTITKVAAGSDEMFRWLMNAMIEILPDVDKFVFTDRVANGFSIGLISQDLLPAFLVLMGYLLPWALLSFYLIRNREIAGAT